MDKEEELKHGNGGGTGGAGATGKAFLPRLVGTTPPTLSDGLRLPALRYVGTTPPRNASVGAVVAVMPPLRAYARASAPRKGTMPNPVFTTNPIILPRGCTLHAANRSFWKNQAGGTEVPGQARSVTKLLRPCGAHTNERTGLGDTDEEVAWLA